MGPKAGPFLLFLLLLLALVGNGTSKVHALSIGAVVDTNSRIGREQKVALEVAAARFNTSSQPLLLSFCELENSDSLLARNAAQFLIGRGAEVIISAGTWPQVLAISGIAKGTNIPTISLTPSYTDFATPSSLVQMSYSDGALVKCLASFVASYKWRRVIMVYEDDNYGTISGTALLLARELQKVGTHLDYSAVFPPMDSISDLKSTVKDELNRMREYTSTVYIILRSSENLTEALFQEAKALGMMDQGSVWICGPDVTSLLDSTFNSSFISNHMQGVIGVQPYVNESTSKYITFYSDFQNAFKNMYVKSGESILSPGTYAPRAYDVIQAISLAGNETMINDKSLLDNLLSVNFTGLSGQVMPSFGYAQEASDHLVYQVINVVGKSYKEIGFWFDGFGFSTDEFHLNLLEKLSVVFWPGGAPLSPIGLRKLKIGVPANPMWDGFIKLEYDNSTGKVKSVGGFCIDVFTTVVYRSKSLMLYEFIPYNITDKFTYNDLVDEVYKKNIDMAIGDITATSDRSENVSFTQPFIPSGLAMIVPMKRDNVGLMLMKPFTPLLWVAIFMLLFYKFGAVWYLEKNHEKADEDFHGPWHRQIAATFWIIGNTLFQNYGDKVGSFYTKSVIISWLVVVLIVSNCFTANLSSILVAEKLKPVVDKSIVGCDEDTFIVDYLQKVLNFKPDDIVQIKDQEDYRTAFQNKNITVAYIESPYVPVFLSNHDNYAVYGEIHMLGGFAFVLPKGDPIIADLSKAILALAEDGTIKKIESKWFSFSLSDFGTKTDSTVQQESLGLEAFWSLFIFSFGFSFTTLMIFLIRKHIIAIKREKQRESQIKKLKDDRSDVHNITDVVPYIDIEGVTCI